MYKGLMFQTGAHIRFALYFLFPFNSCTWFELKKVYGCRKWRYFL